MCKPFELPGLSSESSLLLHSAGLSSLRWLVNSSTYAVARAAGRFGGLQALQRTFLSRSIGGFAADRAGNREHLGRQSLPKPLHRQDAKHKTKEATCELRRQLSKWRSV